MKSILTGIIVIFFIIVVIFIFSFVYRVFISPPVVAELDLASKQKISRGVIQVEILNSTKQSGLANKFMNYLRIRNFDVVKIGNHSEETMKSTIIDRLGDYNSAKKVAYALGISDSLISTSIDSSLFLRCTIIIGNDYNRLKPYK